VDELDFRQVVVDAGLLEAGEDAGQTRFDPAVEALAEYFLLDDLERGGDCPVGGQDAAGLGVWLPGLDMDTVGQSLLLHKL
jgi:hypothetical protein